MLGLIFLLISFALAPFCCVASPILFTLSLFLGLVITALCLQEIKDKAQQKIKEISQQTQKALKANLHLQAELAASREQLSIMRSELNALRVEHYQLSILVYMPQMLSPLEPDPLYLQLKKQFEEKSTVLHNTRKELFYTENALLALQKECALQELEPHPIEQLLIQQLAISLMMCETLELEINELHQVIAKLIIPKKVAKPKKQELLQASFI